MSTENAVLQERRGGELRIILNRPDRMNAWEDSLAGGLEAALEAAAAHDVRSVTVTGAGRAFCSGADLRAGFPAAEDGRPDFETVLTGRYHAILMRVRELEKPVLAAVNGPAAGIGVSLALACDIVVARESAYFLLAFVNIGLVPDGGASVFVPARVGLARASEMAMLGERIDTARAVEWGLINRAIADEDFEAEVDALAERLATGPTLSYAGSKRELNHWLFARMEEQLAFEAKVQHEAGRTDDFVEGVTAFLEKREPRFTGR